MTPAIIAALAAVIVSVAGGIFVAAVFARDGRSWHPGHPVPAIPASSPLAQWRQARTGLLPEEARQEPGTAQTERAPAA